MLLTLVEKIKEAEGVISFVFKPEMPFSWKPGQFLHYTLPHRKSDERGFERFFTIASAPYEQVVYITTRLAKEKGSSFKKALSSLKPGETIEAVGPDGNFVVDDPTEELIFIAGGIGVTPFRAILLDFEHKLLRSKLQSIPSGKFDHYFAHPRSRAARYSQSLNKKISPRVTLLYSNKTENFPYKKLLEKLSKSNPNLKIHYFVDPKRIDENSIRKIVKNLKKPIFYVSGPGGMADSINDQLMKLGAPREHIKKDFFPGYD